MASLVDVGGDVDGGFHGGGEATPRGGRGYASGGGGEATPRGVGGGWCAARAGSAAFRIWGAFAPQIPQQGTPPRGIALCAGGVFLSIAPRASPVLPPRKRAVTGSRQVESRGRGPRSHAAGFDVGCCKSAVGALVRARDGVGGGCCAAREASGSFRIWGAFAPQAPQQGASPGKGLHLLGRATREGCPLQPLANGPVTDRGWVEPCGRGPRPHAAELGFGCWKSRGCGGAFSIRTCRE